ncbi:MAG: GDP-fucose synthetase [Candidatus Lambdaproteobacteria bacterium RIFOXYD2_FULL_50_16]|uniref:GDP-fucose synthetase n=1 Tax=Candidatus Lambdaproteobacteria bacterium RIFOXYD2_FULL_50_16 TaxID=1817772 RepID=A0A1F6G5T2_9PROT|nr:MAG: GDP-fucose synthetase [Candidatus Lambdaproteobacteria bacterium RIFOXYD2_FULL_50_16]
MKVFVTGATGFIGRNLCLALKAKGYGVTAVGSKDADLTRSGTLDRFSTVKYDRIFHLASWTQAGDFCLYHPGEQWIINQQINTNVLSWWANQQPQAKMVSMGTSCTYEVGSNLKEEDYLAGTPIADLYVYAMTKRMLHIGQQALAKQFGLKYLTLVPSTVYGPNYSVGKKQMHFIFDLAYKILNHKHKGSEILLWGDGYQTRELVHIDDFIHIMFELDQKVENEVVNIGAGAEFSIRHFAETLAKGVGVDPAHIQYDTSRYVGAKSKCLNVEKLHRILPDLKLKSLEEGLSQTVQWLEKECFLTQA